MKKCGTLHVVKICKIVQLASRGVYNLLAIMASKRNKSRSGKFYFTGGPVLASRKTPLIQGRKALSCLYFRKAKSEQHIVSDVFRYTGPTAKQQMSLCEVPSIQSKVSIDGFLLNGRDPMQWRSLNKYLVVVFPSLRTNRNKLKGIEDFKMCFAKQIGSQLLENQIHLHIGHSL